MRARQEVAERPLAGTHGHSRTVRDRPVEDATLARRVHLAGGHLPWSAYKAALLNHWPIDAAMPGPGRQTCDTQSRWGH